MGIGGLGTGRRAFLLGATALASVLPLRAFAQKAATEEPTDAPGDAPVAVAEPQPASPRPFDFDILTREAEERAAQPYREPEPTEGLPEGLTYDLYRQIAFNPERARWRESGSNFRLHAFHMGWLFPVAVPIHEVLDGQAHLCTFGADDFDYRHEAEGVLPEHAPLPGVAGFRLHYPLNRADVLDELLAFQGASYFRALGRGNAYGLSARGLALATATGPEEFPNFDAFYIDKPRPGDERIVIHASLDSPSVAGAYRFVVTPGQDTTMEVTARLFFRQDVEDLGVAPLTSMFLFSESNRGAFDDYRLQVHDSDGLQIARRDGDTLWRALGNPPNLSVSSFEETSPLGFGLHQRDRSFHDYEDAEARYEDRPSLHVEMQGDWGPGAVRLIEIPTELEAHDNIVAYWAPEGGARAGAAQEYRYVLHWGMLPPDDGARMAHVAETRGGQGGVAGVEYDGVTRKFVVDFEGGLLGQMDGDAEVAAEVAVAGGTVTSEVLSKLATPGRWRLAIDVEPEPESIIELIAHVAGYGERLTETWMGQWIPPA